MLAQSKQLCGCIIILLDLPGSVFSSLQSITSSSSTLFCNCFVLQTAVFTSLSMGCMVMSLMQVCHSINSAKRGCYWNKIQVQSLQNYTDSSKPSGYIILNGGHWSLNVCSALSAHHLIESMHNVNSKITCRLKCFFHPWCCTVTTFSTLREWGFYVQRSLEIFIAGRNKQETQLYILSLFQLSF